MQTSNKKAKIKMNSSPIVLNKNKMKMVQSLINSALIGLCALPILLIKLYWVPTKRGYFCDDQSISYPYHSSTVKSWMLYSVGFGLPILTILVGEKRREPNLMLWMSKSLDLINCYLMGAVGSQLITNVGKYTVGRLRPHFFNVCNLDLVDCSSTLNKYVNPTYTCLGNHTMFPDEADFDKALKEIHLSFPSGHANFSFQAAVFILLYLQAKFIREPNFRHHTLVSIFSILTIILAFFTAVSRVMDNKHHPTDVLAGALIGTLTQVILNWKMLFSILNYKVKIVDESIPLIDGHESKNS